MQVPIKNLAQSLITRHYCSSKEKYCSSKFA